ncbi:class I SAM-dependent methyltransferase [Aliiglaciecola sp. 3_MG-2023]|uniref:class I SAM-dependent methyltransferase n=1 Tax=Aliiglaciecola sp. 3_MG-2023 TaxID=3062644 RepID=UPI0026E1E89B|nr:class I SAM-dependent methyltransferase [Aliiglaciecola sp. 3_MG-2023]MDO6691732.1 class I SAM-dependent methyltransferase [Aliiglaciecola sp. 3_MG-2023]
MDSKTFLQQKLVEDSIEYFGYDNIAVTKELARIWHDDSKNLNGRWKEIENFDDHKGKILDMACGVGTFLFYGLKKGYDIYGIEPEKWKLSYMDMKMKELNYPDYYRDRIIEGVGENIPFEDNSFDYITTYQTLEHVQNVEKTLNELIRVLKVGGKLKIQAPDYNSFYEPHYAVPFLPRMNKKLAKLYLKFLNKPAKGLDTLNWITSHSLKEYLDNFPNLKIVDLEELYFERYRNKRFKSSFLPKFLSDLVAKVSFYKSVFLLKKEKQIRLVIWKES